MNPGLNQPLQRQTQRRSWHRDDDQLGSTQCSNKICAQEQIVWQRHIREIALITTRGLHRCNLFGITRPEGDAMLHCQANGERRTPCPCADNGNIHWLILKYEKGEEGREKGQNHGPRFSLSPESSILNPASNPPKPHCSVQILFHHPCGAPLPNPYLWLQAIPEPPADAPETGALHQNLALIAHRPEGSAQTRISC